MAQKDVSNKIPIYKLKTTNEVMKYYDEWGKKNKHSTGVFVKEAQSTLYMKTQRKVVHF